MEPHLWPDLSAMKDKLNQLLISVSRDILFEVFSQLLPQVNDENFDDDYDILQPLLQSEDNAIRQELLSNVRLFVVTVLFFLSNDAGRWDKTEHQQNWQICHKDQTKQYCHARVIFTWRWDIRVLCCCWQWYDFSVQKKENQESSQQIKQLSRKVYSELKRMLITVKLYWVSWYIIGGIRLINHQYKQGPVKT